MSIWFTEELHPYYRKGIRIKNILADEQTQFQHLQIVETEFFGKARRPDRADPRRDGRDDGVTDRWLPIHRDPAP